MTVQATLPFLGVRAVIADARRRQRRRRVVAGVAAMIVLGSIAVFALGQRSAAEPKVVKIYFTSSATSGQIARTIDAVKREHGVSAVGLLTKEAALADMRRRFPSLVAGVAYNPLPDSITVRVSKSDAARVIADVKEALPRGIAAVREGSAQG
jgi:cell division protein FtsX